MYIESLLQNAKAVRAAMSTDASFGTRVPTITKPTGDGVIDRTSGAAAGGVSPPVLCLLPYGTNTDEQTFQAAVIGWVQIAGLWVPVLLCQATCTITTNLPGVAGQSVTATQYFCDSIVVTNGSGYATIPPESTQAAVLAVDVACYPIVEVIFNMNASAVSANALYYYTTEQNTPLLQGGGGSTSNVNIAQVGAVNVTPGWLATKVGDGVNTVTVFQTHNADFQALGATAYALNTGGVAQLLCASNTINRQRETGQDNVGSEGVATGTQQLASPISTTLAAQGNAGATSITLTASKFTNRGAAAWIQVGSTLTLEPGTTNQESVSVTAINYGTNVATIKGLGNGGTNTGLQFTHANASAVTTAAYNQARDATTPDGATGLGFAAGATYLFNSTLNAGAGGWESERSAAGELDVASGTGTAIAAEYEFDGIAFDRGRNIFGVSNTYTDTTTASPITAGTNVVITVVNGPLTANMVGASLLLDALAAGGNPAELCQITAVNVGAKQLTLGTVVNNHNASVQVAIPSQGLTSSPTNFAAFGVAAEAAVVYSGLNASTGLQQFSIEKDVNAAGLTPTYNTSAAAGMDADVEYLLYTTATPALTNNQLSPTRGDAAGRLIVSPVQNLLASVIQLFDITTLQTGPTQKGKLFPTTIAITGALPTIGSGSVATLTNSGNVCGAVWSPLATWDSVLLDILVANGSQSGKTLTMEIGRLNASGRVADILATVVYTTSSTNLGATTTNPLTGGAGHASQTWTFFDVTTITANGAGLGQVLQELGGTSGNFSQLTLGVHDMAYYYILLTANDASLTEVLCTITPKS